MPTEQSGGQKQRVAIARALAPTPDVLPLDSRLRERLRREVRRIRSELGVATLYVTHDQAEALAVSDRVAVLSDGRVEPVGTPREVYREPSTRFAAENNLFDGGYLQSKRRGRGMRWWRGCEVVVLTDSVADARLGAAGDGRELTVGFDSEVVVLLE